MTLFDALEPNPEPTARPISLVRLSAELARSVAGLGRVSVEGEVVRPRTLPSGRTYFTLRDRAAQINVTFPGSRARRCRAVHGERVCVTGTVGYLTDRGQVSLNAEEVTPVGSGAIAAMLAETRRSLAAAGLLDRPRRPLPRLPRLVGVVCGADAAVQADIRSVVAQRFPGYPVRYCQVNVSGPGAADSIAGGLTTLLADPEVDVVILARGGGDAAQLLPFSDEALCRAVAAAAVPVVAAIGHEEDRPLCDEVADHRFATPSLAAAAVVPSRAELEASLTALVTGAAAAMAVVLGESGRRLDAADPADALAAGATAASHRLVRCRDQLRLVDPSRRVAESARLLDRIDRRTGMAHLLARARGQLDDRSRTVEALDPVRILQRGYAIVRDDRGRVVRDAAAVPAGSHLAVQLAAGSLDVEVHGHAG